MINYEKITVGEQLTNFIGLKDGYQIEYEQNTGFILFALFREPSEAEIKAFTKMRYFTLTYSEFYNVGFFGIKVGSLPWGDCPFSPIIYSESIKFPHLINKEGLTFNIILIDTTKGEVKSIRVVGLGHEFSEKLIQYLTNERKRKLTKKYYEDTVLNVYRYRSSMDIAVAALIKTSIH